MRTRRGRLRHAQLTLLARPPNRRMTSLHSLYARRAHGEFCEHAWEGGGVLVASSPWRGSSKTQPNPPDPPFPSLYLSSEETTRRYVRKCRASKTAS